MPEVKALKYQSCGAPLEAEEGQTMVRCPFCGTMNMIKPEPGETMITVDLEEITETTLEEIKKVTPPTPPTAASKAIGGLVLAVILIGAIGPVVATIIIPIASKIRGPNYSPLQVETRDNNVVAVLYGDSKYHLGRVNPKTGKLIWRKETGKDYSVRKIAIGEDRLYTSSDDGSVRCYDLKRGSLLWEENPGAVVYQDRNFVPLGDGLCFLGNDDTLRFFDGDGKQTLRRFYNSWRLLAVQGGAIYLIQDTFVKAINPEHGKTVFAKSVGFDTRYLRSDESGIYVLGNAYHTNKTCVVRLDPKTGSVLWQSSYPGTYSYDSLVVTGNRLYLLNDSLISVNPGSGQNLGKFYEEGWEPLKIMSGEKALYIILRRTRGVTAYRLLAMDPGSLASKWNMEVQDTLVLVGDGVFVVDTGSGKARVRKLDEETGKELWTKKVDVNGSVYHMVLADGNLIIAGFGTVVSLRTKDGKRAWKGIRK